MTIATVKLEVERLRDGVVDPNLKAVLKMAAERLVPNVRRLTLGWIADFLRDEGDRAACRGRDVLGSWLTEVGCEVQDLWTDYHRG